MFDDFLDIAGGDYVELAPAPTLRAFDGVATRAASARKDFDEGNIIGCHAEKENSIQSGFVRASLYRSRVPKVHLNPLQPLTNPYRVSQHDQMPVRVIPSPMGKKTTLATLRNSPELRRVKWSDISTGNVRLTPQSKAASVDNLLMTSSKHCYMTRSALKSVNEESKLDESNFSLSSNDSDKRPELSQTLMRNKLRSSKTRKYRQKFNFGIFSKNSKSKSKSEYALNQPKIEFADTPKKRKKHRSATNDISVEPCEKEETREERSFVRNKRRLSSIRLRIQKKFGSKDEKSLENDHDTKGTSKPNTSPRKRKSEVISNLMCDTFDYEANNNHEALSLIDVLNNKDLYEEFHQFLAFEHSDENLDFWTMCEKFKMSSDRPNLAEVICRQFIREGAPREVNLDAETRSTLDMNLQSLSSTSFVSAQESIYRLMEADSFRRFCSMRRTKRLKTV